MSHSHDVSGVFSLGQRRKVRWILAALVLPLAIVTAVLLIVMWPRGESLVGSVPINATGVERTSGVITSIGEMDETGQTPITMETDGAEVPVHVPYEIVQNGLAVGDNIWATFNPHAI
ncbi:MAG: YibE/F family protein, partial [Ancrocorticia sp.]|nr:YibE/F family protein [Ancrocorticia sp.]